MRNAILTLAMALAAAFRLSAATQTIDGVTWTYSINGGGAIVRGSTSTSAAIPVETEGVIAVPASFEGCPVTEIADWAFYRCDRLEGVEIPSSVTNIGAHAFQYASSLASVSIPTNVASISAYAFQYCQSLTNVVATGGVKTIGNYAFANCPALVNVSLPDGLEEISAFAFADDASLKGIALPQGFTTIGMEAFRGCRSLTELQLPPSLASVGANAFSNCTGIASVSLPGLLSKTRLSSFLPSYQSITNIVVLDGATKIADYAFQNCKSAETIFIPNSVTNIGYGAFGGCAALQSLTIPFVGARRGTSSGQEALFGYMFGSGGSSTGSRVTNQDYVANSRYYTLTSYIPTNLAEVVVTDESVIGNYAFENCVDIRRVEIMPGVTTIGYHAFDGCSSLEDVALPDTVVGIGDYSFRNCERLLPGTIAAFPSSLKTIGSYAFSGCKTALGEVVIPEGVEVIGNYAFENCYSVTNVSISSTVTNIGECAFRNCQSIGEFSVPDTVANIGYGAFGGCSSLRSLTIPFVGTGRGASRGSQALFGYMFGSNGNTTGSRVTNQDYVANSRYYTLTSYIPTNLVEVVVTDESVIGNYAFQNCSMLTNIVLNVGVGSIGSQAFYNCTGLTEFNLPEGMTTVGQYAFQNCTNLVRITIPDSIETINTAAFDNCSSLVVDTTTVPNIKLVDRWVVGYTGSLSGDLDLSGIRGIVSSVFSGCTGITSVKLPTDLTRIMPSTFSGCRNMKKVTLSDGIASIGSSAFSGCTSLTDVEIPSSVTNISNYAFQNCTSLTGMVLPEGLVRIGEYAFSGCTSLRSVNIPSTVEGIGRGAFASCSRLATVECASLELWCGIDFADYDSNPTRYTHALTLDGEVLHDIVIPDEVEELKPRVFTDNIALTSVVVPDGVSAIRYSAFIGCSGLTNVVISETVADIGEYAFRDCPGLTTIEIPASVTNIASYAFSGYGTEMGLTDITLPEGLLNIGFGAFQRCTHLESVTVPSSVLEISGSVFNGCTALSDVNLPSSVTNIRESAFSECRRISEIELPASLQEIGSSAFYNDTGLLRIVIPEGVTSIGDSAFYGCTNLAEVVFPSSLRTIGRSAFYGCTSLESVVVPDGVATIGQSAFYGCSSLSNVTIPQSVTTIGSGAFSGCRSLRVAIADGTTAIGPSVFDGCTGLAAIDIPDSVTSIGDYAFRNCSGLQAINLPPNLVRIGAYAFSGCTRIASVAIPEGVTAIGSGAFDGCAALATVEFPESLSNIGDYAFQRCTGITELTIPAAVGSIGRYAFNACSNLSAVSFMATNDVSMSIGEYAFNECVGLRSVNAADLSVWCRISFGNSFANPLTYAHDLNVGGELVRNLVIPEDIYTIKRWAFNGASVTNVVMHDEVSEIQMSAFRLCEGLAEMTLPASVRTVDSWAFYLCTNLTSLATAESSMLTSIGENACNSCSALTNVVIPASAEVTTNSFWMCTSVCEATVPANAAMQRIFPHSFEKLKTVNVADGSPLVCAGAFARCSALETVNIPASVTNVFDNAFIGTPSLKAISVDSGSEFFASVDGALFTKNAAKFIAFPSGAAGDVVLPDTVVEIGAYAFEGCGGLASVTIPAGVAQLPATAFDGTTGMTEIVVADGNAAYKTIDGVVFTKDGRTLVLYPRGRRGNYEIPDGVEEIAASAFSGCIYLTGVELPDSMRSIGYCAFDGCEALTNIDVNENLWEIGSYAFRRCSSLASLTVPDSVAKLGTGAFTGCASLSNLVLPEGLQLEPERLSGTISGTRELSRGVVYHVTGNLTINSGATLTIPSGAVLKMAQGVSITVNSGATLNAQGTRAAPVVFTSIKDDSIGGDTNGDGGTTRPAGGDWQGVWVNGNANFEYCTLMYGGPSNERGIVQTNGGRLSMNCCTLAYSKYDGIWNWGGDIAVTNSVIIDTGWASAPYRGNRNEYVNCIFYGNDVGMCYWSHWSGKPVYKNCIFANCGHGWCELNSNSYGDPPTGVSVANCCFYNPEGVGAQSCGLAGSNGNIWGDPKFTDPANGDFRIAADSLCVDAGDGNVAPSKDYFGQTRQNFFEDATGIEDANGKFPDIGICEILPKVVENDVDLAIDGVEAPATFVVGEKATVSWTVENLGGEPVSGTWSDRVELVCANGSTAVLGTIVTSATLQAGGRRSCSGTFTVPAAQTGAVRVRVTVNANRDVFEGTLTANNVGESGEVVLDMPTLEFPETGVASFNVLSGGSAGYRLGGEFAEGGLLVVRMFATGAARPNVGVWTGGGQVPTRDIFYASAVQVADGIYIVRVPAGGDAYVAFANDGGTGARVDVEPETGGFLLFETGATTAPNAGLVSLTLFGNGFEGGMDVWIAKGGARLDATEVAVFDSVRAVATFDVTGLDAGAYELHVGKGGEDVSAQLLTLTESRIGPKWSCKLDIANSVRSSREYVGYFEYTNSGDMPLDAPYVKLTANKGSLIRFGTADAWGDTLEFMAISETYPVSQLKPGETRRIPFRYKTTTSSLSISYSWTQDDAREFPWATNGSYMRPTWASDEFWGLSLAVLKSNVGNTWNDYLARMRANCDHLAKIGQPTHRLDRIWQLEVNEAMGVDHAVSTLASNTDLARSGRGFGLALSRTYGSGLYRRLRKGVFGYGWSDNYSAYAELQNSGATLALHSGSGSTYLFEKVNGKWTPEDARDKTVCTETATEYVLSYRSGTVQRIAKSNMRVSSVTDNQGNSLTLTYAGEKLTKVEHCDGQSLSFSYANGLLVSATDDQGRTTHYEYNGDLLVKVTAFNGLQTQYRYLPADGSVTSRALRQIVYADGTTRDYTYDGAGRVATVSINGNQQTVEIERGALGTYSVIAPNGGTTTVTLGASGEVLETVNALGQKSSRSYTADTLLEAVAGPTGKRAKIAYDEDGQAVKATDAAGAETSFAYTSDFGNLAKVTDARGNSFDYGYDKKGRSKSISYADGSIESIAYDDRGNVTNSVNRRGQSIAFTYDSEGNILSKIWDDGRTFTWAYDAKGNCTNATDSATGAVTMEYDENERLVRIVHPKGRGLEYEYDALGRTISRTMLGGTTTTADIQKYVYDSLGRLSRMTDGDGNLYVENAYDETTGWLVAQTYGNGTVVSNSYDILGRTTKIAHYGNGGELLDFFEYEYDAEGRRISQTTKEGVERYTYDTVGQLTDVIYPDGSEEHFTYDAVGNRISCTTGGSTVADEYTANNLNQYTEIKNPDGVDASLQYDADGNLVWKWDENGVTEYFYDIQNRLVAVTNTTKDIRWSCEYDVFGNRTKVIDHGTATEILFVQGSLASAVAEFGASNSLATRHILLGSVRLASTTGGSPIATRYYHADGLASTRLITDENGDTVASASYRAFGETRISSGGTTSAGWVGTLGVERDDATGLIFMRNRYYDAEQGRFIQMDPIRLMAGDVNVYRYCNNASVGCVDITGFNILNCETARKIDNAANALALGLAAASVAAAMTGAGAPVAIGLALASAAVSAANGSYQIEVQKRNGATITRQQEKEAFMLNVGKSVATAMSGVAGAVVDGVSAAYAMQK